VAFLGKISAVVSANTRDFSKAIGNAERDIKRFAKSMQMVELNLGGRELDKTLTKVQQFQGKITNIMKMMAAGIDAGLPDPTRLMSKFKAMEDLGKPLQNLVKQFEGLSTGMQAELAPVLEQTQHGFRKLFSQIHSGATTFDSAGDRVAKLRTQLLQLKQAFSAAADLGGLRNQLSMENVGASFAQPRAQQAMQGSLSLRGKAASLPANLRSGSFADLAAAAESNADRIERQAARILRIQVQLQRSGETSGGLNALAAAQQQMNTLSQNQERINARMQTGLRNAQIKSVISPVAISQVEQLSNEFTQLASILRSADATGFNQQIAGVGKIVQGFNKGKIEAKQAEKAVRGLGAEVKALEKMQIFKSISGSGSNQLSKGFEKAASAIAVNRQFIGNFESLAGKDEGLRSIDKMMAKVQQLQVIQQKVLASTDLGSEKQIAALNRVDRELDEQIAKMNQVVAASSNMGDSAGVGVERIERAQSRAMNARGAMSFGGMASFQLAMQQGLFAIDDFMSSTGGIEFKLRAIGNNISQLGLNIGQSGLIPGLTATGGLFLGMGTMMLAHTIPALLKYANIIEDDAIPAGEVLNESLKRQEKAAEALTDTYKELGKSLRQIGMSGEGLKGLEREETLKNLGEQSVASSQERLASLSPEFLKSEQNIAKIKKKLETEANPFTRSSMVAAIRDEEDKQSKLRARKVSVEDAMGSAGGSRAAFQAFEDARIARLNVSHSTSNPVGGMGGPAARTTPRPIGKTFALEGGLTADSPEAALAQMKAETSKIRADLAAETTVLNQVDPGRRKAFLKMQALFSEMDKGISELEVAIDQSLVNARKKIGQAAFAVEDNLQKSQDIIANLEGKTPAQRRKIAQLGGVADQSAQRIAKLGATDVKSTGQAAAIGKAIAAEMARSQNINRQAAGMQKALEEQEKRREVFDERKKRGQEFLKADGFDMQQNVMDMHAATKGFGFAKKRNLLQRGANRMAEGAAPMLNQFAAERETSLRMGPSRQQLNASDIMTTGGRGELERMLRGQDSNRDVNLSELKAQTIKLDQIVEAILKTTGVVVEL
jgi:hypothetical protein